MGGDSLKVEMPLYGAIFGVYGDVYCLFSMVWGDSVVNDRSSRVDVRIFECDPVGSGRVQLERGEGSDRNERNGGGSGGLGVPSGSWMAP